MYTYIQETSRQSGRHKMVDGIRAGRQNQGRMISEDVSGSGRGEVGRGELAGLHLSAAPRVRVIKFHSGAGVKTPRKTVD